MAPRIPKGKVFSVEEANGLLPKICGLFEGIHRELRIQEDMKPDVDRAAKQAERGGGGIPGGVNYIASVLRMKNQLAEIRSFGVEVKDIRKGLCDFPCRREGKLVYLCWHLGEEKIGFWHDIRKGFQGRQTL